VVPENIHTHPVVGHWKFTRGGRVSKAKNFEGKNEAKLEFLEGGGGSKVKKKLWGRYGYFQNHKVMLHTLYCLLCRPQ